uniref:Uncharacterized protein n=1 Tax=Arundo donax TaxID=35708 RepID=A0A0A9DXV4_ARUDO
MRIYLVLICEKDRSHPLQVLTWLRIGKSGFCVSYKA